MTNDRANDNDNVEKGRETYDESRERYEEDMRTRFRKARTRLWRARVAHSSNPTPENHQAVIDAEADFAAASIYT
jgi:hypothetical protein